MTNGEFWRGTLMASALTGCASVTHTRTDVAAPRFAQQIDSLRREARIPGLALAVLHDTTVILARGFGMADIATGRPVTPETPFNTASVSKPISAVVALRLVEEGRLNLDRPMRSFTGFAEFCENTKGAGGPFFIDYACDGERLTLRHVLTMTANGDPGTRFLYNPPSYSWASRPIAEVAGVAFSTLVDSMILRPAGMTHSARTHRRLPLPPSIAAQLALPYRVDSAGAVVQSDPPPPQGDGAAGGVIASATDLARFDIALMQGRLISDASRRAMWTPARSPNGSSLVYGLGWFLAERDGRRLAWHTGLWDGQYSALYLKVLADRPEDRYTLILLANSESLKWTQRLDEAAIERSPFASAFLRTFGSSR